uniref:Uncharacterized protein n=1 Tax=Rhizophagus irregularis (strain DAOM 181602 / DAOM 197198 / MUCL 43194) TaxID=747089 RepID=U9TQM2_RHIID
MNELLRASDELYGPLPSGILYMGSPSDGYSSFVRTTFKRPLQRWFSTGPTPLLPGK